MMYESHFKRPLDVLFSLLALPILLPVALLIALAVWIDDRGPVFYVSDRIGLHGKLYRMIKFRSMKLNAPDIRLPDGSTYNAEDDPRQTRVGKFLRKTSLDELPQVVNILKGEMSLIGPRPDPPDWMARYPREILGFLSAKPGITGYCQAYHRNGVDSVEKMKLDLWYAEHISFGLDARVFFKTFATVLMGSNVYRSEPAPAERSPVNPKEEGRP